MRRSTPTAPGPGVGALPTFGPALLRADPVDVAVDLRQRYGHVVRIPPIHPGLDRSAYLVTHPDDVQSVLQTNPGQFRGLDVPGREGFAAAVEGSILGPPEGGMDWWIQRLRQISAEFSEHAAADSARALVRETTTTLAEFAGAGAPAPHGSGLSTDPAVVVDAGDGLRVQPLMARLSVRLLGRSLFAPDVRLHEAAIVRAVARLRRAFERRRLSLLSGSLLPRLPDGVAGAVDSLRALAAPDWIDRERDPLDVLHDAADELVARRERFPAAFDDAIATWLTRPDPVTGETMSRADVASEVAGMFIAGFATVSAALTWAVVLLATRPALQTRLRDESLDSRTLGSADAPAPPDYEALLADLPTAHRVFRETLRLYPTLPVFGRTTREPVTLGGYPIAAGSPVLVSPYVTHRDPAFWDRPEEFDPGRFDAARARDRPEFAYYPFSAGAHGCLGRYLATAETVVALATLCRAYHVDLVDDAADVGVDSAINLEPDRDVRVRLRPRTD